jgi:hypothetical protein
METPSGTFSPREKAVIARGGAGDPNALKLALVGRWPRLYQVAPSGLNLGPAESGTPCVQQKVWDMPSFSERALHSRHYFVHLPSSFPAPSGYNWCSENTLERGHLARISRRKSTYAAGKMPALQGISYFLVARRRTGMSDCF